MPAPSRRIATATRPFFFLGCQRSTTGHREAGADDAAATELVLRIKKMHVPALALP